MIISLENARLFKESLERQRLQEELNIAREIQQGLLASEFNIVDGWKIFGKNVPSLEVGGDYFDFFPFRGDMQAFTIADVMGKGLPASMLMSNLQASLRILGPENDKIENTVTRLNELFRYNLKTIKFITLFIAAIDVENNILHYCNAGHNPPLWLKNKTDEIELLNPTGPALGIITEPEYKTEQIAFSSGDIFLFYTDGLTEAQQNDEEFGEEKLKRFLRQNRDKSAQQILEELFYSVKKFSNKDLDDLTSILIKVD